MAIIQRILPSVKKGSSMVDRVLTAHYSRLEKHNDESNGEYQNERVQ